MMQLNTQYAAILRISRLLRAASQVCQHLSTGAICQTESVQQCTPTWQQQRVYSTQGPAATLLQSCRWQSPKTQQSQQQQQLPVLQQLSLQHHAASTQYGMLSPLHWQQQQQQQYRQYSVDDAARRRLLAAQQRRQRQQELEERRAAAAAAGEPNDQLTAPPPPPPSSPVTDISSSTAITPQESTPSELQVESVVGHEALIVTRSVEWGTVLLGFEQATKYSVLDQTGAVVALIAEEVSGIGNEIQRQLLRTRRSFTSTVLSADGSQVVFRVRRPAYLINSYMYIEDPAGEVIGEVRQRWHPWRRQYDLYIGRRQFAAINSGFLAWEFEMKDAQGNTLALIDRNFIGFAKELFTDAGKYVVHFGYSPQHAADICSKTVQVRSGQSDVAVTPLAQIRTDVAVIPTYTGNQLVVPQPLPLSERLIALAAAISVDYNYFSRLSTHSGLFSPPLFMPIPVPSGGVGGVGTGAGSAAEGAAGAGTAAPTAAAGAEAASSAAGGVSPPASGSPVDQPSGFGGGDESAGFGSGLGSQGAQGFGDDADSFRWDTSGGSSSGGVGGDDGGGWGSMFGGGDGGGDDEGSSGLWGILVSIWAMIFGE